MALYRLQESYSIESSETLLESFEAFVLTEASRKGEKVLTKELETQQQQFEEYSKKIEAQETELKKVMEEKPKSWLERPLMVLLNVLKKNTNLLKIINLKLLSKRSYLY